MIKRLKSFISETLLEAKKVTWPTTAQVKNDLFVIIVVSLILGVVISLMQTGVQHILKLIIESQR